MSRLVEPETDGGFPRHPISGRALEYWRSRCPADGLPPRRAIDPTDIVDILPNVVLMDVLEDPRDFQYRLVGTVEDEHMRQPYTGKRLSEIAHQGTEGALFRALSTVVDRRTPMVGNVPYVGPQKDFITVEDVIMPLSCDGRRVTMLFITLAFIPNV